MRRPKSIRPQVEGLESLVFLSTVPTPLAARAAEWQRLQAAEASAADADGLDLSGSLRGNYRLQIAPDGSSGTFQLQGIGNVRGLGPARVAASYAADQSSAPETLTMTLTARRGSVTLQVGRVPGDVDPDASTARLRYTVVSGTGAFAGSTDTGVLDLTLRPQMRSMGTSGQMSITLRPDVS